MKETDEKEFTSFKPKYIENGMRLSEVREILNNVIATTAQLAEQQTETGQTMSEAVQNSKELSEAIKSIQEAITNLDQRITALEKTEQ